MTDLSSLPEVGFISEPDRVLVYEGLAEEVILGISWEETPFIRGFLAEFKIDSHDYLVSDDFYQGTEFTRVITRRSDGRKFGFTYWDSPGNDRFEAQFESNAEDQGFTVQWDDELDDVTIGGVPGSFWVFLPAEPVYIRGFQIVEVTGES